MRSAATISVLAAAALLSACGAVTKSDIIARANAICASTVRQTRLIVPPAFGHGGAEQLQALAGYASKVLPLVKTEAKQLRGLPHPQEDAKDNVALAGFLAAFSGVVSDYQALDAAAAKADGPGVAQAEAALTASRVGMLASAYGVRSCASPGSTSAA